MKIGLCLDASLELSWRDHDALACEAAQLGYESLWTTEGNGRDAFEICAARWRGSRKCAEGGLITAIGVAPVMYRSPMAFATSAAAMAELTGGRFILGIASGSAYRADARRAFGLRQVPVLELMRDYMLSIKALLTGEAVDYEGPAVTMKRMHLASPTTHHTPLYLGALGPKMLGLGGELADGVCLNWCSPEQVDFSRQRIAEGALRVGRNPTEVEVLQYICVAVDEDAQRARHAVAKTVLGCALGATIPTDLDRKYGYRAHFDGMGFAEELLALDVLRSQGATMEQLAETVSDELLTTVACYGTAAHVGPQFMRLASALDRAIVRPVATGADHEGVRAVMAACAPQHLLPAATH